VAPRSEDTKLIIRAITFELVQPICPRYINVTDRQTDGQTDGRTTYDSNTALALCASRGKNYCLDYVPPRTNAGNATDCGFCQYKVYADIHGDNLETRRQTTWSNRKRRFSGLSDATSSAS